MEARQGQPGRFLTDPPPPGPRAFRHSSVPLFDALAGDYDAHFQVAHRWAYDELAWEVVSALLPGPPGPVIDAGCGNGRWAARLVAEGYRVTGIERAPAMVAAARARGLGEAFGVVEGSMEEAGLPPSSAAAVVAMGSLQYTGDPEENIRRFAAWVTPGGWVFVLVDSLVGLVLELLRTGRPDEAARRVGTRVGRWRQGERWADHHLLDRARLERAFEDAGLVDVRSFGLLTTATAAGAAAFADRLAADRDGVMAVERALMSHPVLADAGKQLLVVGHRPDGPPQPPARSRSSR